jgi:hypothetical protein
MGNEKTQPAPSQEPEHSLCRCCSLKEQFQTTDHEAAYQALALELERAGSDQSVNGRHRAAESLNVILHFFMHGPGSKIARMSLSPLWSLAAALDDLERGAVSPMLKPKKITHRPPELIATHDMKRGAVTVCTLLMKTGLTLSDAAKVVSKALATNGFSHDSRRPLTHRTILNWRARYDNKPDDYINLAEFEEDLKSLPLREVRIGLLQLLIDDLHHNCLDRS